MQRFGLATGQLRTGQQPSSTVLRSLHSDITRLSTEREARDSVRPISNLEEEQAGNDDAYVQMDQVFSAMRDSAILFRNRTPDADSRTISLHADLEQIWNRSVGSGTAVTSTARLSRPDQAAKIGKRPWSSNGNEIILIVDDDPEVRRFSAKLLQLFNYPEPLLAENGPQALQLYREHPDITAAIIDKYMPDMSGAQLIEQLRLINPHFPVVLITGDHETQLNDELTRTVFKPARAAVLAEALRRVIDKE